MKAMSFVLLMVLAIYCQQVSAVPIFSDGFESGGFGAWTLVDTPSFSVVNSAIGAHSGTKRAKTAGPNSQQGNVLLLMQSTSGYQELSLNFWYRISDGLEDDHVFVEWTADDKIWQQLADYTQMASGDWQEVKFPLPVDAEDNALFGFRIKANLNASSDSMSFDDFVLSGEFLPEPATVALFILSSLVGLWSKRLA